MKVLCPFNSGVKMGMPFLTPKINADFPSLVWIDCCNQQSVPSILLTLVQCNPEDKATIETNADYFVVTDCDKAELKAYLQSKGVAAQDNIMTDIENSADIESLICGFCRGL